MSEQPAFEITQDDKLIAALGYVFTPLVPIIILLMEDKKERPFIKAHNMQTLVLGIVLIVYYTISSILTAFLIGCGMLLLGLIVQLYWAYKAYQGELINIPVITDFVKNQGWA
jgi:uncharacterized membrane protein